MPRQLRVEYPGAMYHVMSRGDRREAIFLDDVDRQDFIKTLAEACQKTGWQVHAYCLMPNHYHLVLETPNANLVAGMAWLQSAYTIRLNHRHKLAGHVFSGRYKAQLVEGSGNGYLHTACDYVHLNPMRARLFPPQERLLAYPWSSLAWYLAAPEHRPQWVRVDRLLGEHGIQQDTAAGRQEFERAGWKRGGASLPTKFNCGSCAGAGVWVVTPSNNRCWSEWRANWASTTPANSTAKAPKPKPSASWSRNWAGSAGPRPNSSAAAKSDPAKLAIGARLRSETTLSLKNIAARMHLGAPKGAHANLHKWMRNPTRENPAQQHLSP